MHEAQQFFCPNYFRIDFVQTILTTNIIIKNIKWINVENCVHAIFQK